jgi:hypothetical protein
MIERTDTVTLIDITLACCIHSSLEFLMPPLYNIRVVQSPRRGVHLYQTAVDNTRSLLITSLLVIANPRRTISSTYPSASNDDSGSDPFIGGNHKEVWLCACFVKISRLLLVYFWCSIGRHIGCWLLQTSREWSTNTIELAHISHSP